MELGNPTCKRFIRQINDQIAAGQQFDYLTVNGLKDLFVTSAAKKTLGIDEQEQVTLYEIVKDSVEILGTLRFIYLSTLVEAFGKEYIAERESIPVVNVRACLRQEIKSWEESEKGAYGSTSLFNFKFLRFVLEQKYRIDFASLESDCFWEGGLLRNCLVHQGGVVGTKELRMALRQSLNVLEVSTESSETLRITAKLVWKFIDGSRSFIATCDY